MSTQNLIPGANHPVPTEPLTITVQLSPPVLNGVDVDISAFLLHANGKVHSDADMVFYGQPHSTAGEVVLLSSTAGLATFSVNLPQLRSDVAKVAFTASIYANQRAFSAFTNVTVKVLDAAGKDLLTAVLPASAMSETALILGELYLRQAQWKFRAVGQGFVGGLKPLAEYFGVAVSDAPVITPPAAATSPSVLPSTVQASSPFILDKSRPRVSLDAKAAGFGEVRIQLLWQTQPDNSSKPGLLGGLFGSTPTLPMALQLACCYELQNGVVGCVQTLGNAFGALQQAPFIQLHSAAEGEWLHINGQHWTGFKRLLVYASAARLPANWDTARGVLTLYVPDEAPLEIRLTDGAKALNTCAVLLLENQAGGLLVNRELRYFSGQQALDAHYRWGLAR